MKRMLMMMALLFTTPVSAALDTNYQNLRELDQMVAYLNSHPELAYYQITINVGAKRIDLEGWSKSCSIEFDHQQREEEDRFMPGPAPPLVVVRNTCADSD